MNLELNLEEQENKELPQRSQDQNGPPPEQQEALDAYTKWRAQEDKEGSVIDLRRPSERGRGQSPGSAGDEDGSESSEEVDSEHMLDPGAEAEWMPQEEELEAIKELVERPGPHLDDALELEDSEIEEVEVTKFFLSSQAGSKIQRKELCQFLV